MAIEFCKGGCGKPLTKTNKTGFAWGHANGCRPNTPADAPEAAAPEAPVVPDYIECLMTEAQLLRIWNTLPLHEKATAILTALEVPRA